MTVLDELLRLEHQGWESLCTGDGATFYTGLMTDDARMVLANGMVMDRDDVASSLADAPPWDGYQIDDAVAVPITDDVATLVYVGTGRRGDSAAFVGAMSSTYVRSEGRWRLALYQQTAMG